MDAERAFALLGVPGAATPEEIRAAYERLSRVRFPFLRVRHLRQLDAAREAALEARAEAGAIALPAFDTVYFLMHS